MENTESSERQVVTISPEPEITRAQKKDFHILVVDDEDVVAQLMWDILTSCGYTCAVAHSYEEALATVRKLPIHLVITDIKMPGHSGVELAAKLREDNEAIMVVFVTGYAETETMAKAIGTEPLDYLQKPFESSRLRETVHKAHLRRLKRLHEIGQHRELREAIAEKTRELEFRTERLLAEKNLLHGILSHASFGLLAVDVSGIIHIINETAVRQIIDKEFRQVAFEGMLLADVATHELSGKLTDMFEQVLTDDRHQPTTLELELHGLHLSFLCYAVHHRKAITAVVFVSQDITEKTVLQKRLLQTAKLASIGELAAGVAHEINNPVGFITSNCNTLQTYAASLSEYFRKAESIEKNCPFAPKNPDWPAIQALKQELDIEYIIDDMKPLINETIDGLGRVAKIVKDLKTFARTDDEELREGDINALLDDALNLVRNEVKYKLTIHKDLAELPKISCHPSQLVQVFTNLFINAAHAVKDKGTLDISTRCLEHQIDIRVKDSGSGIAPEHLPHIFDPFFTTKPPGQGTGMGLSISYGIIQKHGGSLTVQSEPGKGTEFTVSLPLTKHKQRETETTEVPS